MNLLILATGEVWLIDFKNFQRKQVRNRVDFTLPRELTRATLYGDDGYFYSIVRSSHGAEIVRATQNDPVSQTIFHSDSSVLGLNAFQNGHLIFNHNGSLYAASTEDISNPLRIATISSQALIQIVSSNKLIVIDTKYSVEIDTSDFSLRDLNLDVAYPGFLSTNRDLLVGIPGCNRKFSIEHNLKAIDVGKGVDDEISLGKGSISDLIFESRKNILVVGKSDGELTFWRVGMNYQHN